jgi:hypothetical protein
VWAHVTIRHAKVAVENGNLLADLDDGQLLPQDR